MKYRPKRVDVLPHTRIGPGAVLDVELLTDILIAGDFPKQFYVFFDPKSKLHAFCAPHYYETGEKLIYCMTHPNYSVTDQHGNNIDRIQPHLATLDEALDFAKSEGRKGICLIIEDDIERIMYVR